MGHIMCNKGTWIKNMKSDDKITGFYQVDAHQQDNIITLIDISGKADAYVCTGEKTAQFIGQTVWVSGMVMKNECNAKYIKLHAIITAISWVGNPFSLISPNQPYHRLAMQLFRHLESIHDDELKQCIEMTFSQYDLLSKFMTAPASLHHHHAYRGGLATHTCEVLNIASTMGAMLSPDEYALVMTACFLHDIGKVLEYAGGNRYLSKRGALLGHEITMLEIITPIANRIWSFGDPKRLMLLHLLTAKPAPQWTGIRQPRVNLVSLIRFADSWSAKGQQYAQNNFGH